MEDPRVKAYLTEKLREISAELGCQILLVAEKSSRVWGTASKDSDYDIKMIYKYSLESYVKVDKRKLRFKRVFGPRAPVEKDRSEFDIEIGGWDIREASKMVLDNDPGLLETFTSPIVYFKLDGFDEFCKMVPRIYDYSRLMNHYRSWAQGHIYMLQGRSKRGKGSGIPNKIAHKTAKVILYVVRGILSAEWLKENKTVVGMPLAIEDLLSKSKMMSPEMRAGWCDVLSEVRRGNRRFPEDRIGEECIQLVAALNKVCPPGENKPNKKHNSSKEINKALLELICKQGRNPTQLLEVRGKESSTSNEVTDDLLIL